MTVYCGYGWLIYLGHCGERSHSRTGYQYSYACDPNESKPFQPYHSFERTNSTKPGTQFSPRCDHHMRAVTSASRVRSGYKRCKVAFSSTVSWPSGFVNMTHSWRYVASWMGQDTGTYTPWRDPTSVAVLLDVTNTTYHYRQCLTLYDHHYLPGVTGSPGTTGSTAGCWTCLAYPQTKHKHVLHKYICLTSKECTTK